ncbi:MAG: hypothetical protein WBQ86_01450 [Candidatus Binatus sp.]
MKGMTIHVGGTICINIDVANDVVNMSVDASGAAASDAVSMSAAANGDANDAVA